MQMVTYPLQTAQMTFLLSCNLEVLPLYKSSKVTLKIVNIGNFKAFQSTLHIDYKITWDTTRLLHL